MAKKLFVSPRGRAEYPYLNPKSPDTKFKKGGEWHVKLVSDINDEQAVALKKTIDATQAETFKKAKAAHAKALSATTDTAKLKKLKAVKVELCEDLPYHVDEAEGTITFSFKKKASGERQDGTKWKSNLPLFDAKGAPITKDIRIGGGSELKVSYEEPEGFFNPKLGAGVTLRMEGVQILVLREWSRDAASMGFQPEEGFDSSESGDSETAAVDADGDEEEDAEEKGEKSTASADDF
jgi:hypothetical protein